MDDRPPRRRHPHHFDDAKYEVLWEPVWFTSCTRGNRPILTRGEAPAVLVDAMTECATATGCALIAWCIMPDHVHLLACVSQEGGNVRRLAERTRQISGYRLSRLGLEAPIWHRDIWDHHVRGHESLDSVVAYILGNPVRAGLCERQDEWPYSAFLGYPKGDR